MSILVHKGTLCRSGEMEKGLLNEYNVTHWLYRFLVEPEIASLLFPEQRLIDVENLLQRLP